MAPETEQRAQREDLRTVGDAALVEGGEALAPELLDVGEEADRVFLERAPAVPDDAAREEPYPRRSTQRFRRGRTPWLEQWRTGS